MTDLTPEVLAALRESCEEHIRLGGFANSQTWIQECPPHVVRTLLNRIDELKERIEEMEARLDVEP